MRWLARRWGSVEDAIACVDVVVAVVRVVWFWCACDGHVACDVVEREEVIGPPVEPCAAAYTVEVWRPCVEADCRDQLCVVKAGPEVVTHGANGAIRND